MADSNKPAVAVIVPAKDEAARIGAVLRAVVGARLATEIIVVSDGSTDGTEKVAAQFPGVKVIALATNVGKAGAMVAGVKATTAKIVAFVDADLSGLQFTHIDRIILPVLAGECEMCVGVFRGGKTWSDAAQIITPNLSGQRAMTRELFESIPDLATQGMGVETALNLAVKRRKSIVVKVELRGVSNCHKEQKMGLVKGIRARTRMFGEIATTMVRTRRPRRTGPRRKWL